MIFQPKKYVAYLITAISDIFDHIMICSFMLSTFVTYLGIQFDMETK